LKFRIFSVYLFRSFKTEKHLISLEIRCFLFEKLPTFSADAYPLLM